MRIPTTSTNNLVLVWRNMGLMAVKGYCSFSPQQPHTIPPSGAQARCYSLAGSGDSQVVGKLGQGHARAPLEAKEMITDRNTCGSLSCLQSAKLPLTLCNLQS